MAKQGEKMTTEVIVKAHCAKDKEVLIRIENDPGDKTGFHNHVVQDGETWSCVVYDYKSVRVYEQTKTYHGENGE